MILERALESILIFICLALQERVPDWLTTAFPSLKGYELGILIGWWIVLIAIYFIAIAALKTLLRSFPMWRGQFPQAVLEGTWLQHVSNERPWGVSYIKYDWRTERWIYMGIAFDEDMNLEAEWQTYGQQVIQDGMRSTWHLGGQGKLLKVENGIPKDISTFDVAVILNFEEGSKPNRVTGKAADLNFHRTSGGANEEKDIIFGLVLTRVDRPSSIIQEARGMTRVDLETLFAPIREPAAARPAANFAAVSSGQA